ncbi:hypothetical protein EIP86_002457 [Pleurotus ostreatoroseus]|nr:hypothetical protein EIP86_002457 [Pleurotus ostreatoroseus]
MPDDPSQMDSVDDKRGVRMIAIRTELREAQTLAEEECKRLREELNAAKMQLQNCIKFRQNSLQISNKARSLFS